MQTESAKTDSGRIGIACDNPMHCRLLESAATHLGLTVVRLDTQTLSREVLDGAELVLADAAWAPALSDLLRGVSPVGEPYRPALLLITEQTGDILDRSNTGAYDGVLPLPQAPGEVAAQLSIALFAHRAFARRYESALEELRTSRTIFHSVTNGISISDALAPDMPLTYVNPAFEVVTGYPLEEVIGRNCRFLQGDEHDQPGLKLIREALREGRETTAVLRNFRRDGTPFWNELTLSPIRGRDGRVAQFVGIQADVTARVEMETALRESEKLAVAGRLAASIAHEINNPLESVTNLSYLAEHSDTLEEAKGYLAQLDAELRRIKLITAQALRFARQSTQPTAVRISDLAGDSLDMAGSRITAAGVVVERRDRPQQAVLCMESEIRQVINNLIGNATDAMRGRPGSRLLVRTRNGTEPRTGRDGVVLTVADNGTGIPAGALREIYRAFFSTKGIHGTGLGLWISSEIVNRHRGSLSVRSRTAGAGAGTVFRMFLPSSGTEHAAERDDSRQDG